MGTNVRTKFSSLDFTNLIDEKTMNRIQQEVIEDLIKTSIEVGNSPVQGYGRFVGYSGESNRKTARAAGKKPKGAELRKLGYPFSVQNKFPGKQLRPVNLELSGEMLSFYVCKPGPDKSVLIGIQEEAPDDVKARAEGNNGGTKNVPARKFVPGPGEVYKPDIMTAIRQILADRLVEMIKESEDQT